MAGILLSKIQNELLDLQIKKVLLYMADVIDGITDPITGAKAGDFDVSATAPLSAVAPINTAAGSLRAITGEFVIPAAMASGTLVGVRGAIDAFNGITVNGSSFLFGTQGKIISGTGTIDVGSGHVAGVYGQLDLTGGTITSGHVAAVIADIQGVGSNGPGVDLVYAESATGTPINSMFKGFGKSTYVFDLASNTHTQMSTTGTAGATATKGWLKVLVEGVVRYIPLTDSVS